MRPKRCHDRFCAMRIAPAIGPLSIKIVRMVGDTAHLSASPSLILSSVPEGQRYQCGKRFECAIQFCDVSQKFTKRAQKDYRTPWTSRDEGSHSRREDELDSTPARNLPRPSCEIVDRTTDQVIDTRSPLSKSRSAAAASENELVLSEQIDCPH